MALTLDAEQRLESASFTAFFQDNRATWLIAAQRAHQYIKRSFPADATIRHDDVAKALRPTLEVNGQLSAKLAEKKLRQKYWIDYFADLIIDRTWGEIDNDPDD